MRDRTRRPPGQINRRVTRHVPLPLYSKFLTDSVCNSLQEAVQFAFHKSTRTDAVVATCYLGWARVNQVTHIYMSLNELPLIQVAIN
jgi:hypothetical protein